jgi:hypothetical protein
MASNIIMFWDRINVLGDPLAGIEVLGNPAIAVPENACGFRLCLSTLNWHDAWYFAHPGLQGLPFTSHGITCSSSCAGVPSADAIVATGPVHGCQSGSYQFQRRWGPSASERRHPTEAVGGRWRAFTVLMSFRIYAGQAAHFGSSPDALWMFVRVTIRQPKPTPSIWPRSWLRSRLTDIS